MAEGSPFENIQFSLGTTPRLTREEQREKIRQKKRLQEKKQKRHLKYKSSQRNRTSQIQRPLWRITRDVGENSFLVNFCVDSLEGDTYFKKLESLKDYGAPFVKDLKSKMARDIFAIRQQAKASIELNQKLRWKFKAFLNQIHFRKTRDANDMDPITLGPVEKPVYITKVNRRLRYIYEAEMVMRDIHSKLTNNDGQIPDPVYPRNPLTNQDLNLYEMVSVHKQCKAYGYTTWAIEGFAQCDYSIDNFLFVYRKQLRIYALNAIMKNNRSYEYIDMLLDFIEIVHDTNNVYFIPSVYRWGIIHMIDNSYFKDWEVACKRYHTLSILHDDYDECQECLTKLQLECLPLIYKTKALITEEKFRRRPSAIHIQSPNPEDAEDADNEEE